MFVLDFSLKLNSMFHLSVIRNFALNSVPMSSYNKKPQKQFDVQM